MNNIGMLINISKNEYKKQSSHSRLTMDRGPNFRPRLVPAPMAKGTGSMGLRAGGGQPQSSKIFRIFLHFFNFSDSDIFLRLIVVPDNRSFHVYQWYKWDDHVKFWCHYIAIIWITWLNLLDLEPLKSIMLMSKNKTSNEWNFSTIDQMLLTNFKKW